MYISFDAGANWRPFQLNLPIVSITDLALKNNNLIVATQGRSLYIIDDLSVLHQASAMNDADAVHLYKPKDTYRMDGGSHNSNSVGTNHPSGVMTYFYLPKYNAEKDSISLTYFDAKNDTIKSYSTKSEEDKLEVKEGANQFNWDMTYEGAERLPGMILWWASTQGPKQIPGNYTVKLNVNGTDYSQPYTVLADPRSEASVADMQAQFDFIDDVNATVDHAHKSIKKIRNITGQLSAFEKQYKTNPDTEELREKSKKLREDLEEVEKALYQTKNRSGQDPLNFPIKLTNKLAHLNALVGMGDFAPTDQDVAVKDELTAKIDSELNRFDKLVSDEVAAFNKEFNAMQLNYLFIQKD